MSNHDDFLDEYIEYRIFEESMKESGNKPSKHGKRGSGCGTTAQWYPAVPVNTGGAIRMTGGISS